MDGKTTQTDNAHSNPGRDPAGHRRQLQWLQGINRALASLLGGEAPSQALYQAGRTLGEGAGAREVLLFYKDQTGRTEGIALRAKGSDWEKTEARGWGYPLSKEADADAVARLEAGRSVRLALQGSVAFILPIKAGQAYPGTLTLLLPADSAGHLPELEQWILPFTEALAAFLAKGSEKALPGPNPYRNFFENSTDAAYYTNCGRPIPTRLSVEEQTALYFENAFLQEGNIAMAEAYGYSGVEAMAGRKVQPPTERDIAQFQAFIRNGYRLAEAETTHTLPNGDHRYFLGQAVGVVHDGHLLGIWGTQKDITEKREAENRIRAEQSLKQNILSTIPDHILVVAYDSFRFSYLNQEQDEPIFGYYPAEIDDPGRLFQELVHPDELATRIMPFFEKIAGAGDDELLEVEYRLRDPAGRWRWIYQRARIFSRTEDGRVREYLTLLQDITDRKEAELSAHRQRDYLRQVIDLNPNLIFAKDREGRFTLANQAVARVYQTSVEELIGKKDADFNPHSEEVRLFLQENREVLDSGRPKIVHHRIMHEPGGKARHVQVVKKPLKDARGEPTEVLGVITDLTYQKQVEEQIREEQKLNQSILDTLPDFILVVDYQSFHFTYLNQQPGEEVLGYPLDQLEDPIRFLLSHIHPEDLKDRLIPFYKKIAWAGDEDILEEDFRIRSANGDWVWLHQRAKVFRRHPDGSVKEYLLLLQDVTTAREAGRRIEESEKRLERILEGAKLGIWDWDLRTQRMTTNDQWAQMLGYEAGEIAPSASAFFDLVHPADREKLDQAVVQHLAGSTRHFELEIRMRTRAGDWKWIYDRGQVVRRDEDGTPLRAFGVHIDITERKQAELALMEREALFRSIFESSPLGITFSNAKGRIRQVNQKLCETLGYERDQLVGKAFTDITHPEDLPMEKALSAKIKKKKPSFLQYEKRFLHREGKIIWAGVAVSFIYHPDGRLNYTIGMVEDITEKKNAVRDLEKSEALQKAVIAAMPDMKFRFNLAGVYLDYYPSADAKDHPFVKPDRFLQKNVSQVLPAPVADTLRRGIKKAIEKAKVQTIEFSLPAPEGEKFYEARISAINQEEAVVIVRDITGRIEAEANLQDKVQELDIKNQQLKAYIDSNLQLENFAYIASHDLREPVRTMRSFAQLLHQRHRDQLNEQAREYLQFITDGAEHMNRLIEDLLAYSRVNSQPQDLSEVSPASLIGQVTAELTGVLRETGAEIETAGLPATITANPTRLRQLLQNLIGNAVKFHRAGVPPRVRITGRDRGGYWQFAVADNGIGIQAEFHEKIFRLFQKLHPGNAFQGTGLGLAICKKIVEQHQGDIWLTSEPGVGTTFFFTVRKSTNDKHSIDK